MFRPSQARPDSSRSSRSSRRGRIRDWPTGNFQTKNL